MGIGVDCYCRLYYQSHHSDTIQEFGVSPFTVPFCADNRLDDLFLGIGGLILVETYIVGTVIIQWVKDLDDAVQRGDIVFLLNNAPRLIRYWYSTSATYIFSVVLISASATMLMEVVYQIGNCMVP